MGRRLSSASATSNMWLLAGSSGTAMEQVRERHTQPGSSCKQVLEPGPSPAQHQQQHVCLQQLLAVRTFTDAPGAARIAQAEGHDALPQGSRGGGVEGQESF